MYKKHRHFSLVDDMNQELFAAL